jgi:hypothetical protein
MASTACQKRAEGITVKSLPSDELLKNCPKAMVPPKDKRAYEDLIKYSIDQKHALDRCNADKAALRKWKSDVESKID